MGLGQGCPSSYRSVASSPTSEVSSLCCPRTCHRQYSTIAYWAQQEADVGAIRRSGGAMPIPPTIPPMHWLRAIFGLMTRQDGIRVTTPGRCPASDSPRCHRHIGSAWSDHGTTYPGDLPRRLHARRVRRKSLYLWDSSAIGHLPSNPSSTSSMNGERNAGHPPGQAKVG